MWMRGGTSKGGYFLKDDLPADVAARDAFLLAIMGSPDPVQIDGMGGADPLTSKVAVISKSSRAGIDVDYLFLQVFVDQASLLYLEGAEVDYVETLEGSGFKFSNPNVKSTCGCGSSFSA